MGICVACTPLLFLATGLAGAPLAQLEEAVAEAHRSYSLEAGQELLPELESRWNLSQGSEQVLLAGLLAKDALLVASLLRYAYEQPGTSNAERRDLGRQIDEAAATGFAALNGFPESSEKYRLMADFYMMMMRTKAKGNTHQDAMEAAIDKAFELDPDNPNALVTKSRRLLFAEDKHGGDFEAGLVLVGRALELAPEDESNYIVRGLAYERHDMLEKAMDDWRKALEINPDASPAQEHLDRAQANLK